MLNEKLVVVQELHSRITSLEQQVEPTRAKSGSLSITCTSDKRPHLTPVMTAAGAISTNQLARSARR